jgi:carbon-monoxide dehydrogenase small subunit
LANGLIPVVLNINGMNRETAVRSIETLADTLRNRLGLTGTRVMCNEGECGSCTILLDGKPVLSCLLLTVQCENKNITTIEGLTDPLTGKLHPIQQSFVENGGIQCGVCTPGMILTAKALLDKNPDPTIDEVREALAGNLCRCGTYNQITESVLAAAKMMKET